MKKNIIIFTMPLMGNYGGILQAYALQYYLKILGYNVFTNNIVEKYSLRKQNPISFFYRAFKRDILKNKEIIINFKKHYDNKYFNTKKFISKNILTVDFFDSKINYNDINAFIVGSDQVWRARYKNCMTNYFDFLENSSGFKRIAYSASFGVDNMSEYSEEMLFKCKNLIKKFDAVSVRESSGVDLCKKYFNVEAEHLLDPTMLLEKKDYSKFISKNNDNSKDYIACYFLKNSENIEKYIENLEVKTDCISKKIMYRDILNSKTKEKLPSVEDWLSMMYYSKYVVTDSFHGMLFSIIFNKQFVVVPNKEGGLARIKSMLSILGLENRLVDNFNNEAILMDKIDFIKSNLIIKNWRKKSKIFLQRNLNQ